MCPYIEQTRHSFQNFLCFFILVITDNNDEVLLKGVNLRMLLSLCEEERPYSRPYQSATSSRLNFDLASTELDIRRNRIYPPTTNIQTEVWFSKSAHLILIYIPRRSVVYKFWFSYLQPPVITMDSYWK